MRQLCDSHPDTMHGRQAPRADVFNPVVVDFDSDWCIDEIVAMDQRIRDSLGKGLIVNRILGQGKPFRHPLSPLLEGKFAYFPLIFREIGTIVRDCIGLHQAQCKESSRFRRKHDFFPEVADDFRPARSTLGVDRIVGYL